MKLFIFDERPIWTINVSAITYISHILIHSRKDLLEIINKGDYNGFVNFLACASQTQKPTSWLTLNEGLTYTFQSLNTSDEANASNPLGRVWREHLTDITQVHLISRDIPQVHKITVRSKLRNVGENQPLGEERSNNKLKMAALLANAVGTINKSAPVRSSKHPGPSNSPTMTPSPIKVHAFQTIRARGASQESFARSALPHQQVLFGIVVLSTVITSW